MGYKKKKRPTTNKKRDAAREELDMEEAREELLALSAIFGEALAVRDDEGGFTLRVVPHPGEAMANHVAVQLIVSYPRQYPGEPLVLKLAEPQGLADADVKALSKQLHQTAAQYAQDCEVCCFQLVTLCQEFLQQRNAPPEEVEAEPPPPESLWHEMQLRERTAAQAADAADVDFSFRASGFLGGDNWGYEDLGGSLFAEAAEPVWTGVPGSPPAQAMSPIKRAATKAAGPRQLGAAGEATTIVATLRPEATSRAAATAAAAAAAASPFAAATAGAAEATARAAGAGVPQQPRQFAAGEATMQQLSKAAGPSVAAQAAGAVAAACTPGAEASAAPAAPPPSTAADVDVAGPGHSLGPGAQQEQSKRPGSGAPQQAAEAPPASAEQAGALVDGAHAHSVSRMNSMLTAVKHSIRAVLPRMLRRQLDGPHDETASEAGESTAGVPDNEAEREQIRRELLLGHLLALAASGGNAAVPPHALPAVAAMLTAQGLLPKWVGWTLTQQPALFDRAFQRLFAQEMKDGASGVEEEDPSVSWALERFWHRRTGMLANSRSLSALRSKSLGLVGHESQQPASRYETDFAEIRQLGRGGYGVVMAAVNRMDGRQYAIKKIPLDVHTPSAYARIMREVTTLSRLQHPNVVRYFQAWVENTTSSAAAGGSDSELSEWEDDYTSSSPTQQPGSPAAHRSAGGGAAAAATGALARPAAAAGAAAARAVAGPRGVVTQPSSALYPLSENSLEGRASSPSQPGGYGTSQGAEPSTSSEGQAAFGNLAVVDGARLLSAHGSQSRLTAASEASTGAAWQSARGGSESGEEPSGGSTASSSGEDESDYSTSSSTSSSEGEDERGEATTTTTTATTLDQGSSLTSNSAFTFERSRPSGAGTSGTGTGPGGAGGGATGTGTGRGGSSSQLSRPTKAGSPRLRRMLYIQMEFCPRTLRDVLDSGPIDDTDRWRVLRQILAGLAHIHSQGIIHRDLKPANIFYDAKGDIKLGDFGLAKFSAAGTEADLGAPPAALPVLPAAAAAHPKAGVGSGTQRVSSLPSEATGVCGTSYYISPEIANGWASYDEKVDLYSLGVVAFELWHPFSTGMERVVLLRDLVMNDVMPADFEGANPVVCKVIRWLMARNPAQRPTAKEVLRSDLLPATVGDEQLRDLIRSLPDNPATYDRVVDAVFNLARGSETGAADEAAGAPAPVQMAARDHIVECVKEVFGRHGAVPMCSLDVGFATAEDPKGAMQVVSPSGVKLALRYEMRQPFANWVVHQVAKGGAGGILVDGFRRYELSWVQRRVAGQAGLPRSYLQADLDFVLPAARTPLEQLLGEAEVMSAVHDVLLELPECGHLEIRIGHRQLFEQALQYVGVSRELRGSVVQLLSTASAASPLHAQARSKRWPSIRAGLEGLGLGQEAIGRCRQLVLQWAGEAEVALYRLRTYLSQYAASSGAGARRHPGVHRPLAALDELQTLLGHLAAWGIASAQVVVDPLVPPHAEYFSGPLFQFHSLQEASGATAVVAVGGRYDGLLKVAWARQAGLSPMPPMGAVGATLNVERLVSLAAASARWRRPAQGPAGLAKLSQADVLVCSRGGGGLLKERMQLVRSLWEAGVAAEMLHAAAPSLTEQYEYANARGIPWLVIIESATFSAADTVKVKHLERRLEEEVPVADVARYLQGHGLGGGGGGGPGPGAGRGGLASLRLGGAAGEGEDGGHGEGAEHDVERSMHGGRERERRRGRDKR